MRKWLCRLAPCLTLVLALASCNLFGAKSSDATLSSLSVAGYTLNTNFSSDVTAYAVVVAKTASSVNVTAATNSDKATLSWNKTPSSSSLVAGPNVFIATVTAQDGTTLAYTLTVYRANATAELIDSVNGSKLATGGSVSVYSGGSLLYSTPFSTNPQPLWLGSGVVYTVKASPTGRAQSSKEDLTGADDLELTMICQQLDMDSFPAESPEIQSAAYTSSSTPIAAATGWTTLASGASLDFSAAKYLKLVVTGKAEMDATSWSGFGIMLGVDQSPTSFSGLSPEAEISTSSYDASSETFTGTAYFDLSSLAKLTTGAHTLSFVVYDRANNRTEQSLEVTNTATVTDGTDISADYFQSLLADLRIYGVSRAYFSARSETDSLSSLSSGAISYRATVSFKLQDAASNGNAVPILGFKVLRSDDGGASWTTIGKVNYGSLSTGTSGTHSYYDADSQLTTGVSYKYKVVAFTDDAHEKESAVMGPVAFLPPFTVTLVGPADKTKALDPAALPNFTMRISDSSLWDSAVSDGVYLSPVIREADGTHAYYGYLYYSLSYDRLYYRNGNSWSYYSTAEVPDYLSFKASSGVLSMLPALFNADTNRATGAGLELSSGTTYYWDLFGDYEGSSSSNVAAYFQRSGNNCVSRSYANVYQDGQDALNGWFSFTVK